MTNFEALSAEFLLQPALGRWAPNAIYIAAAAIFRNCFSFGRMDTQRILASQLGLKTFKTALYLAQTYSMDPANSDDGAIASMGRIKFHNEQLVWHSP